MFSCEEVLAGMSEYMDDEPGAAIRKQIEDHMVHCRSCRAIYDSTRKTLRIVTDTGVFELPQEVSARIAKNIRAKIQQKS
jgi:predicted anti-sigma-YlaC factor YlaD